MSDEVDPGGRACIAVTSERLLGGDGWRRRRLAPVHLTSLAPERLIGAAPAAIVADLGPGDALSPDAEQLWRARTIFGIPIVVVADASAAVRVRLLQAGADEVVAEPLDQELLAAQVAAVLRRRRHEPLGLPAVVRQPGLEIDLVRHVVRRQDGSRPLSRTEFRLLLALLQAAGRTCTHRELIRQVWSANDTSAPHYLRLYIRYLREKIEEDPRHPRLLLNVWGRGYRFALDAAYETAGGSESTPYPSPAAVSLVSGAPP